ISFRLFALLAFDLSPDDFLFCFEDVFLVSVLLLLLADLRLFAVFDADFDEDAEMEDALILLVFLSAFFVASLALLLLAACLANFFFFFISLLFLFPAGLTSSSLSF